MRTISGRRVLSLMLVGVLVWLASGGGIVAQSGGNYFDKITVGSDIDMYGTGAIRDSLSDTVQAMVTSGHLTVAGNATSPNVTAGATGNAAASGVYGAVIAGGGTVAAGTWGSGSHLNLAQTGAHFSVIGGGLKNRQGAPYATIGGGQSHTVEAAGWWGTIGGGQINRVQGPYGVVAGGFGNTSHNGGAVLGGTQNTALAQYSGSVAGYRNEIDSVASMGWIGGGYCNTVGTGNTCLGSTNPFNRITVGGGTGTYSLVAGGDRNAVSGYSDSILNGFFNTVSNEVTATVTGVYTTGLFGYHTGNEPVGSVFSEYDFDTSVATCNTAHNSILGGEQNTIANAGILTYTQIISAYSEITPALVVGCYGGYGLVGTGVSNTITGTTAQYTTILNGFDNEASGRYSTILNGYQARAVGEYSLASGRYARALHDGAFVWADGEDAVYSSTVANSFNVRAGGGVTLTTSGAGLSLDGPVIVDGMTFTYTAPITITGVLTNVRLLFYQVP